LKYGIGVSIPSATIPGGRRKHQVEADGRPGAVEEFLGTTPTYVAEHVAFRKGFPIGNQAVGQGFGVEIFLGGNDGLEGRDSGR
jgi:hypothetical protein